MLSQQLLPAIRRVYGVLNLWALNRSARQCLSAQGARDVQPPSARDSCIHLARFVVATTPITVQLTTKSGASESLDKSAQDVDDLRGAHLRNSVADRVKIALGLSWTCRNAEDPASRHRQNGKLQCSVARTPTAPQHLQPEQSELCTAPAQFRLQLALCPAAGPDAEAFWCRGGPRTDRAANFSVPEYLSRCHKHGATYKGFDLTDEAVLLSN